MNSSKEEKKQNGMSLTRKSVRFCQLLDSFGCPFCDQLFCCQKNLPSIVKYYEIKERHQWQESCRQLINVNFQFTDVISEIKELPSIFMIVSFMMQPFLPNLNIVSKQVPLKVN